MTCNLTADFIRIDGKPWAYLDVWIEMIQSAGVKQADGSWTSGKLHYRADENGHLEMPLLRGGCYRLRIGPGMDAVRTIDVPDQDTFSLIDLMVPRVSAIDWVESSYELEIGESASVQVEATLTDLSVTELTRGFELSIDVPVVTISGRTITGDLAGSGDLSLSIPDLDELPQPTDQLGELMAVLPELTLSLPNPITVTVG